VRRVPLPTHEWVGTQSTQPEYPQYRAPIVQSTHSTQGHREYEHIAARLAARGEASRCQSRPHGSQQCVHDGALR
jgi:hypothetical protein